jgi:signal peptidase II
MSLKSWIYGPYSGLGLSVGVVVAGIDQAHKWWMLAVYDIAAKGRVRLTSFFDLIYTKNTGISYGLFAQDSLAGQYALAAFAILAVTGFAVWLARAAEGRIAAIGAGLIMGGAIGNGIDRVLRGGVADFFSFHAYGYYWYIFNIADAAIVAGVAALLYDSFVLSRKNASKST